jgi:hypothetical protein
MRPWALSTLVATRIITSLHTYTGVVSKATGTEAKILPNSKGKDMEIQFARIRQELKSGPATRHARHRRRRSHRSTDNEICFPASHTLSITSRITEQSLGEERFAPSLQLL